MSYAIVMFDCPSAGEEEMASKIEAGLGFRQTHIMEHQRVRKLSENKEVIIMMMVKHEVSY